MPHPPHDFAAYARSHRTRLATTALLLCQEPRDAAELARDTLVVVHARWRRIPRDDVDFYVRRSLVKRHLSRRRRRSAVRQGELARLSARQRVVLVLLHWEGLGEVETAQVLGWSVGAVRSRAQRGLAVCGGRERLCALFAEAVRGVGGEVSVEEVELRGRELRRRRLGAVAVGCALLLAPPAVLVAERAGVLGGIADADRAAGARTGGVVPGPIRVLAPGERVEPVPGLKVWLTSDGEHWSASQAAVPARAAGDRVSVQMHLLADGRYLVTGRYEDLSTDPRRVEVSLGGSVSVGTVLTLAGGPGWGVWYLPKPLDARELKESLGSDGLSVTVYDADGRAVARSGGG